MDPDASSPLTSQQGFAHTRAVELLKFGDGRIRSQERDFWSRKRTQITVVILPTNCCAGSSSK